MRLVRLAASFALSFVTAFVLLAISAHTLQAQLTIRPIVVPLGDAMRVSDFTVRNDSETAQEVSIDFRFGYLRTDSVGGARMVYDDSVAAQERSMSAWTSAFPRRFVLPAGGEQVVRISARPPAGLSPGVYWTRLVTGSQPQSRPADAAGGAVASNLVVRIEQVTTVLFRHGEVTGGVAVGQLSPHVTDSSDVHLLLPLTRTAMAPFIGQSRTIVRDARGNVVHQVRAPVAVYYDFVHRISVPRTKLAPGSYTAEVRVDNEQSDVPVGMLPRVTTAVVRTEFVIH